MSIPPDDRQQHDRTARPANGPQHGAPAPRHTRPATQSGPVPQTGPVTAGVSPGSTFAPISLRPAVDVDAVQERLRQLGQTRSTDALAERAELLRLLGRLDESLSIAEEVFRLTMFTGERADAVSARIRRAHVLHDLGRYERAVTEAALARDTATIEEWPELEGAAAELEGWSLFELSRIDEARAALGRAYEAFRAAGAPAERTQALRTAVDAALRGSDTRVPAAAPEDPQRAARDAAVRTEQPPTEPRRTVLGAPDAARTEESEARSGRRPLFGGRTSDHTRPTDDPDAGRPRGGLWHRGGDRDGGDHRR